MDTRNINPESGGLYVSCLWKGLWDISDDGTLNNRRDGEYSFSVYREGDESVGDELLASVVLTFPVIDGERSVFINKVEILSTENSRDAERNMDAAEDRAFSIIEGIAKRNGYRMVYAGGKVNEKSLQANGFRMDDGVNLYKKELRPDS